MQWAHTECLKSTDRLSRLQPCRSAQPREGRVRCVALTSTGSIVLVGGFDRKATLQNVCAGTELYHFPCAEDVVRSVHLSADSSRLAIGSEKHGKGCVCLYDTIRQTRLAEWEHPKSVWCVRLSPDARILAAAGYAMKMSIYDTHTLQLLQEVAYTSTRGPAFIWSMDFSRDSSHLALGCWSGNAHLYRVTLPARLDAPPSPAAANGTVRDLTSDLGEAATGGAPGGRSSAAPVLTEVACVARTDRVYAVALDASGAHLCIAGRDKKCALYECNADGSSMGRAWEATSDDFIYAVALSADLTYCVYGGTSKAAIVLDGRTGVSICHFDVPGTVWTLSLMPDSSCLAIGGELPTVTVFDLHRQCDVLQLPTDEITYSTCISPDSLCFTNGIAASMYGKGGTEYTWRDPPSFGVVSALIMTMLSSEEELLHCTRLIVHSHPAIVNCRDPDSGASLLQFVIATANRSRLLDILLDARCRIGVQADARGRTCLHVAHEQGKWHSLQQLLDALRQERFSIIPGSMRLVAECFEAIATDYPLDFLHYIAHLPMQPEPEVLGDVDAFDVMLPSTLLCGSSQRCPKGIWSEKLAQYSVKQVRARGGVGAESGLGRGEREGGGEGGRAGS